MKTQPEIVNINEADMETLAALPGIGPTLADRIISYRQDKGLFQGISELAFIQGISGAMVNDISEMITVGDRVVQVVAEEEEEAAAESQVESAQGEEPEAVETGEDGEEPEEGMAESQHESTPGEEPEATEADDDGGEPDLEDVETSELTDDIVLFEEESLDVETTEGLDTPEPELDESEDMEDVTELPEEELRVESDIDLGITPTDEPLIVASTQVETRTVPQDAVPVGAAGSGCSIRTALLGGILGGLLGLALAIILLFLINGGSLIFADADSLDTLESDTQTQINEAQEAQVELEEQIQDLKGLLEEMVGELDEDLGAIATRQSDLSETVNDTGVKVSDLEESITAVEEEIVLVVEAAEDFRQFLSGLRDLLSDIAETPEAEGTPRGDDGVTAETATPTPDQAGAGSTATRDATASPTNTPRPTRTPRPTATPIGTQSGSGAQTPRPTSTP